MNISLLTVFPESYSNFLKTSLIKRAQEDKRVLFDIAGFFSFCEPKERIDAPTVGHGSGMAIRPEVIERAVSAQEAKFGKAYRIFVTPQGKKLDQREVKELAQVMQQHDHVMFVAGRYEGIDERAHELYADREISIGDYILMGGDLPVMVILEAVLRYFPGIVGKNESVDKDSFSGAFFDYPPYVAPPRIWHDKEVPGILLSGNHALMEEWRIERAVKKTVKERFDWIQAHSNNKKEYKKIFSAIPSHYVALMHDEVIVQQGNIGTSSVTTLDIHDIARSSATYGIKNYFLVTSLDDQKAIIGTMLDFWATSGVSYNKQRHDAVSLVKVKDSLTQVIEAIEKQEGKKPLVIATSAKATDKAALITYKEQYKVWHHDRPVLLIFGTAQGLSDQVLSRCDYVLLPVHGFTSFNHLSVRSAVAIILDRWLGVNLEKID